MELISLQQLSETLQVPVPRGGVPGRPVSAAEVQSEAFWGARDRILTEKGSFGAELNVVLHWREV